jgi:uncharacterized protein (TIGR00299 family) protein
MLLAGLLDVGAPAARIHDAVSAVLGRRVELETVDVTRGGLRALLLRLPAGLDTPRRHRGPLDLVAAVERAGLAEGVRERATAVFSRLAQAEARVHGMPVEEVRLDELGADDTLVDVVGISAALDALDVGAIAVSPLPVAHPGRRGSHGATAPATLELLRGFTLRPSPAGDDLPEPVTPTAAAVFAALSEPAGEIPEMRLEAVGLGAGTNDPALVANVVRVLLGTPADPVPDVDRRLAIVEANVDDLAPELVPDAIEALFAAGAVDAWSTPIVMKLGRPALTISALCEPGALDELRRAFFESTSTLGVRIHAVNRPELERRVVGVDLAEGGPTIRVKIAFLDGRPVTAKPEHADVVEAARKLDRPVRSVHEAASAIARWLLEERS